MTNKENNLEIERNIINHVNSTVNAFMALNHTEHNLQIKRAIIEEFNTNFIPSVKQKLLQYGIEKLEFSCNKKFFQVPPAATETIYFILMANIDLGDLFYYIDNHKENTEVLNLVKFPWNEDYALELIEIILNELDKNTSKIDKEKSKLEPLLKRMRSISNT